MAAVSRRGALMLSRSIHALPALSGTFSRATETALAPAALAQILGLTTSTPAAILQEGQGLFLGERRLSLRLGVQQALHRAPPTQGPSASDAAAALLSPQGRASMSSVAFSGGGEKAEGVVQVKDVSAIEAHRLQQEEGYTYVDVRSTDDYTAGHAAGAESLPVYPPSERVVRPDFVEDARSKFSPDAGLLVACYSGGRSKAATSALLEGGFTRVFNIKGGLKAWQDEGFEVVGDVIKH